VFTAGRILIRSAVSLHGKFEPRDGQTDGQTDIAIIGNNSLHLVQSTQVVMVIFEEEKNSKNLHYRSAERCV